MEWPQACAAPVACADRHWQALALPCFYLTPSTWGEVATYAAYSQGEPETAGFCCHPLSRKTATKKEVYYTLMYLTKFFILYNCEIQVFTLLALQTQIFWELLV